MKVLIDTCDEYNLKVNTKKSNIIPIKGHKKIKLGDTVEDIKVV